ncbi:hypothetical protein COBT_004127, partial [Conglomerata obtusa]
YRKNCINKKIENSFIFLKSAIAKATYRMQPDLNKTFILTTDASSFAIGVVLSQINNQGKECM